MSSSDTVGLMTLCTITCCCGFCCCTAAPAPAIPPAVPGPNAVATTMRATNAPTNPTAPSNLPFIIFLLPLVRLPPSPSENLPGVSNPFPAGPELLTAEHGPSAACKGRCCRNARYCERCCKSARRPGRYWSSPCQQDSQSAPAE